MKNSPNAYRVQADAFVCRLVVAGCLVLTILTALSIYEGRTDDVMRWVVVRDLLNGQGWFDLYQYRLGPDDGTLMHWSRLVDAPIAALYLLFELFLPPQSALHVTAIAWPAILAGLALWAFTVTGGVLGGRPGAVSALIFGAYALANSRKFNYFSFDHHGYQIMLFAFALMFFVLRKDRPRAGLWLGVCLALSMSIGTESMVHTALIGAFFAADWVVSGKPARQRVIEFGAAIAATLLVASLATTSSDSFFFAACDALTLSIALPAGLAGLGLVVSAAFVSHQPMWVRAVCFGAVGGLVIVFAQTFAPHCLENPIDQMPLVMREFWLSQITEAQNVLVSMQRHTGETIALTGISCFVIVAGLVFARASETRIDYLLLSCLVLASLVLFFYQIRMVAFLTMSLVAIQAQVLRVIYQKYKASGRHVFGLLMIVFAIFMSPKTGIKIENQYDAWRLAHDDRAEASEPKVTVKYCATHVAYEPLNDLPPGFVVAGLNFAGNFLRYTHHSVLGGNYHRNEAGNLAQIELFRSDTADIGAHLAKLDVDYVILCKEATRAEYWDSVSDGEGLPAAFVAGNLPDNVEEIPRPEQEAFRVFRVNR